MTAPVDWAPVHAAIAAATGDVMPGPGTVVRLRTLWPERVAADSTFVGSFADRDAWAVAGRLAAALGGTVVRDALYAIHVTHGRKADLLSMREVADRAGLAEATIRTYRTHNRSGFPPPDVMVGRAPGWLPATVDPWIAELPGRGARTDLLP